MVRDHFHWVKAIFSAARQRSPHSGLRVQQSLNMWLYSLSFPPFHMHSVTLVPSALTAVVQIICCNLWPGDLDKILGRQELPWVLHGFWLGIAATLQATGTGLEREGHQHWPCEGASQRPSGTTILSIPTIECDKNYAQTSHPRVKIQ